MKFYVYILYRPWNDEPCYVGKGQGNRVHDHAQLGDQHYNKHLSNVLKKAGGKLPHQIIFKTDDEQEAFAEEIRLIALYGRKDLGLGPLCNKTDGGDGHTGWSPQQRQAKADSLKGTRLPTPVREKMSVSQTRRWESQERRDQQSATLTGKKRTSETCARLKASWTPERREKHGASRRGKPFSGTRKVKDESG